MYNLKVTIKLIYSWMDMLHMERLLKMLTVFRQILACATR